MSPLPPNHEQGCVIHTLGTSTRTSDEFVDLFKEHEIEVGIDIRSFPTSRFPYFMKESLRKTLESRGIDYCYLGKELGGFRKGIYLAYMETDSFKKGLKRLGEIGSKRKAAFFCSERFPRKCRRRWVSGELIRKRWKVAHIIERGKILIPRPGDQKK